VKYQASPQRWWILAAIVLMMGFNYCTISMFTPIIESVQAAYQLPSPILVSMNAIVWTL